VREHPHARWVSLAYLLTLIGTVSAMGRIADMVGRKLLYVYGFIAFAAASLGCGLAPSLAVLLIMRTLQGVGAAMLQANSVALIRTHGARGPDCTARSACRARRKRSAWRSGRPPAGCSSNLPVGAGCST
jgi:MFS family permease